jgi:anti-sigma factor RsiW
MDCNETIELLPLSIDRELDARTEGALTAHLASCAACDKHRQQLTSLGAAVRGAATYHRAPASLRDHIEASLPPAKTTAGTDGQVASGRGASGWRFVWQLLNGAGLVAAACAALVLVLVLPQSPSSDQRLTDEIVASHARALLTDHVVDIASSDQHTVKPWFSAKLDFSPPVRDLAEQGFPLVGGRLDYLERRPVAVLVYRHRQHQIEVFVWPADGAGAPMTPRSSQGYHVIGWTTAGMKFRAVSDVDATELQRLTDLLQHG